MMHHKAFPVSQHTVTARALLQHKGKVLTAHHGFCITDYMITAKSFFGHRGRPFGFFSGVYQNSSGYSFPYFCLPVRFR